MSVWEKQSWVVAKRGPVEALSRGQKSTRSLETAGSEMGFGTGKA